ncbi:Protein of unknown function [Actinopolymorpha cephalotaxi]|uniref:DUF3224 domain-containing protein n=1 Tax=Actinopolymorpha cephalotaxi TaxID=504797 RepID=A0A1I2XS54_9ACTN|nr:DUF3224 domain-containing protein [Actinopolymorpha cephalotaxi]NYH87157.1 hypothetical protein [Actinopolymorpha cephalotaxi]SFH16270.1 Protein of unknown function [Actinopolymorpha cephalotaxi]
MGHRATGSFEITRWDATTEEEDGGVTIASVLVGKEFRGGLTGTSTARLLTVAGRVPTSAAYVAIERMTGTLDGRTGTFVVQHAATMETDDAGPYSTMTVTVVPDTGTGELTGIRGEVTITVHEDGGHTYAIEYDFTRP